MSSSRVLVVEDDHATQLLLQAVLARNAIPADCAIDGEAAMRKIVQEDFAAIVLDLLLPVRNGFEILRDLKRSRPEVLGRIIIVTAASDSTWSGCDEIRLVHGLIRKPIDIDDFVGHVRECMAAETV